MLVYQFSSYQEKKKKKKRIDIFKMMTTTRQLKESIKTFAFVSFGHK